MLRSLMSSVPFRIASWSLGAVMALASLIYWGNGLDQLVQDLNDLFYLRF